VLRFDDSAEVKDALQGAVVAIGNFDGLHRGHQALFTRAKQRASERSTLAAVLTFQPHPARVLAPEFAPLLILTLEEKIAGIEAAGLDAVVVQPFDRAFARTPPRQFVDDLLLTQLGCSGVVVGEDFNFGHKGAGRVGALKGWLEDGDATLDVVPTVMEGQLVCSSTKLRELLFEGRVDAASVVLGRPYTITGVVEGGDQRGKKMKVPTANLRTARELLPRMGVYATRARLADGRVVDSVTNIGLRPTFNEDGGVRIEAHLLDFEGDLYEQPIELELVARLRDERKFDSTERLKAQIARDVEQARAHLATEDAA
jgi:riboflavin kinase/FMN adenylyltransferase